jgi:hypothetical protein
MLHDVIEFVLLRLCERSTWLGLISLATAAGLMLSESQQEAVIAAGSALAGLIAALTPDKKA